MMTGDIPSIGPTVSSAAIVGAVLLRVRAPLFVGSFVASGLEREPSSPPMVPSLKDTAVLQV